KGRSSCRARARSISSSVTAFIATRISPILPPLSAWRSSASSIFSGSRPTVRTRISPRGRIRSSSTGTDRSPWICPACISLIVSYQRSGKGLAFPGSGRGLLRLGGGLLRGVPGRLISLRRGRVRPFGGHLGRLLGGLRRGRFVDGELVLRRRARRDAHLARRARPSVLQAAELLFDVAGEQRHRPRLAREVDRHLVLGAAAVEGGDELLALAHLALED